MDLEFLRHLYFWRPLSRQPSPAFLLGAGAAFWFVIMVGADFYLGRVPTLRDVADYLAVSLIMSPLGGLVIALKGGWIQQRYGRQLLLGIVVIVVVGILAAWLIGLAA